MLRYITSVAVLALALALSAAAFAETAPKKVFGGLPTHDGRTVFDWQVAIWIERYFQDGTPGDGSNSNNNILVFTQCFGGDALAKFDDTANGSFDRVAFTNTTVTSASSAGRVAYYNGYDNTIALELIAGFNRRIGNAHNIATSNANADESPQIQGDTARIVGGETSTHVLVWAGDPNSSDYIFNSNLRNQTAGAVNRTFHSLMGDGSQEGTEPATLANLEATLAEIGALMDDGEDEQFIFFVTDHGSHHNGVCPGTLGGLTSNSYLVEMPTFQPLSDPGNQMGVTLLSPEMLTSNALPLNQVFVTLNGVLLGLLLGDDYRPIELPNGEMGYQYWLPVDESAISLTKYQRLDVFNQTLGSVTFDAVTLDTGAIAKPSGLCDRPDTLCVGGFEIGIRWRGFGEGQGGLARKVPVDSNSSGVFYFFDQGNYEYLAKIVDGCVFNNHYWFFGAGPTNTEYTITVTKGGELVKTYSNPLGQRAPAITDTFFYPCTDAAPGPAAVAHTTALEPPAIAATSELLDVTLPDSIVVTSKTEAKSECVADDRTLCLYGGRFRAEVDWRDFSGNDGAGSVVPLRADDSGVFWFFNEDNWEMLAKVIDGCGFNDKFWVLGAAITNAQYTFTVTDTVSGLSKSYTNPLGQASEAIVDISAFDACE